MLIQHILKSLSSGSTAQLERQVDQQYTGIINIGPFWSYIGKAKRFPGLPIPSEVRPGNFWSGDFS
jgi:hypothetical protein